MHIVCDIGATNIRLAGSHDLNSFSEPQIHPTPKKYDEALELIKKASAEISHGEKVEMFSSGMRGLDRDKTTVRTSESLLSDWAGKPLGRDIATSLNAEVHLENDTAVVGLGEAAFGPGKDSKIVVYITISSGVGGVRIVDKHIDPSAQGYEPGHQLIDPTHSLIPNYENSGFWEDYISGTAVEKRFSKPAYEISDDGIWDEIARFTAYGLTNVIVHWSPDMIVLGGSMMKDVGIKIEAVEKYLHEKSVMRIFTELPEIKKAQLGDLGGLWGAMELTKNFDQAHA